MQRMSMCFRCKHFTGHNKSKKVYECKAFPEGIPLDVILEKFKHTKKHPQQKGDKVYEFDPEKEW